MLKTQLHRNFDTGNYQIGASRLKQFLWYFTDVFFFKSRLIPFSGALIFLLRMFGAKIGQSVRIKPGIHVKYPWKLVVGNFCWLADCYLENMDWIVLADNCCISQQAMLMTGNHDYSRSSFDLLVKPIHLEEGCWVGAGAKVCPGVTLKSHSILSMGSVATKDLEDYSIYQGCPAVKVRERVINC